MAVIIKQDGDTQAIRDRIARDSKKTLKYILETRAANEDKREKKQLGKKSSKGINALLARAKNKGKQAAERAEKIEEELAAKKAEWEKKHGKSRPRRNPGQAKKK